MVEGCSYDGKDCYDSKPLTSYHPHKATKIIESGYLCPHCGEWINNTLSHRANQMKIFRKYILDILTLAGAATFSILASILIILSWFGGKDGAVSMTFNTSHERLSETIIIILLAILVVFRLSYKLIKRVQND